jgi:hypothetical protein
MASRILNRRELRKQADQAELAGTAASDATLTVVPATKKAKAKAPAAAKVRKPRKPKTPPRVRARWGVFDMGMKQVAIFDYNQRAAADEKLAELLAKKKGIHFLQIVKELMPEPEPAQAPLGEMECAAVDATEASRPPTPRRYAATSGGR